MISYSSSYSPAIADLNHISLIRIALASLLSGILEKLGKKLIKSIWVYNYTNPTEQAPYSVIMLGPHDKLTARDKITKFKSIEIQIFNAKFNKEKFTLEPQLLRKVTAIK